MLVSSFLKQQLLNGEAATAAYIRSSRVDSIGTYVRKLCYTPFPLFLSLSLSLWIPKAGATSWRKNVVSMMYYIKKFVTLISWKCERAMKTRRKTAKQPTAVPLNAALSHS